MEKSEYVVKSVPSEAGFQFEQTSSMLNVDDDERPSQNQILDTTSTLASGSNVSSLYRIDAKDSKGVVLLVSRKVTVTYGPYTTFGNMDYGIERLEGIIRVLQRAGADVIVKPSYHYNEVRVWHLENMIYSCKITDLQYAVDGDLDHRALEAGKALKRSTRKAHVNLKERYKTAELIMAKCPCHADFEQSEDAGLIQRVKMSDRARRGSASGGTSESELSSTHTFPHFFQPELYREAPVKKVDKDKSRIYEKFNEGFELNYDSIQTQNVDEEEAASLKKSTEIKKLHPGGEELPVVYEAYTPKKGKSKKGMKSRAFSVAQGLNKGDEFIDHEHEPGPFTPDADIDIDADDKLGVDQIMQQVASFYDVKQH